MGDSLSGVLEPEALPVGHEDMDAVGQPVEHGPGQPFAAEHFSPVFNGQVGRHDQAGAFLSPADHLKEKFGSLGSTPSSVQLLLTKKLGSLG